MHKVGALSSVIYVFMKMIKKFIFILAVAVCAASCMDSGQTFKSKYRLQASFEYSNPLPFRADSLCFAEESGLSINWHDLAFCHKLNEGKNTFLGGFIVSCMKGGGEGNDRFRVNSGAAGNVKTANYIVYYENPDASMMPEHDMEFLSAEYGTCLMLGCYVNNTREVVEAVKKHFVPGDKLTLKMTGYMNGKATGSNEFVLAEYTEQKDSLVTSWRPFTLNNLGMVEHIDVAVISTKPEVPSAVCLDDIFADVEVAI